MYIKQLLYFAVGSSLYLINMDRDYVSSCLRVSIFSIADHAKFEDEIAVLCNS